MEDKKVHLVFKKVKELTKEDRVLWREEADGSTFYTSVSDYKIYIGKSVGTVSFELFNHHNEKIGMLEQGGYFDNSEGIDTFYEAVRKKVLKIDDGLDDLLNRLDQVE
ncbi:MAG: hypothetical protein WBJ10_15155 [Daejeonella sp.]|uniref:hypothetical protein n=1 Tax=Daejeonella sp. TaxID=2805397 RepID=UPI003C788F08